MEPSRKKQVLVGVTGGIAAYKTPDLVRRLKERGARVRVVMSQAANEFVTPLTLQAVSGHPVFQHLLDAEAESGMGHIELARWADTVLVAPATAHFIAKMAHGQADDLLSTLILATTAPVFVAPAMNQQMWQHAATQKNLQILIDRGITVLGPGAGNQACGEVGPGRMLEPAQIAQQVVGDPIPQSLAGSRLLMTAGPTWEAIDPVRGITNHSSGRMGYALAEAARDSGATVTLVSGPVHLATPEGVERIDVVSAQQMMEAVAARLSTTEIFIAVAAVADYRPASPAEHKVKKNHEVMSIELVRNPDILATVAAHSRHIFTMGFAAETENMLENAYHKLRAKRVDMVAANLVTGDNRVFGSTQNAVTLISADGETVIDRMDKQALALEIIRHLGTAYERKNRSINDALK